MMKLILSLFIFIIASSYAGDVYDSSKTSHYENHCPKSLIKKHKRKSVKLNFCEYIKNKKTSFAFMIKRSEESGVYLETYKIENRKETLIKSVKGLGYFLRPVKKGELCVVEDFSQNGNVSILLRAASSPNDLVIGYTLNASTLKLSSLISRKIDIGDGEMIYEDSITIFPADKINYSGNKLEILSRANPKRSFNLKGGQFQNY